MGKLAEVADWEFVVLSVGNVCQLVDQQLQFAIEIIMISADILKFLQFLVLWFELPEGIENGLWEVDSQSKDDLGKYRRHTVLTEGKSMNLRQPDKESPCWDVLDDRLQCLACLGRL